MFGASHSEIGSSEFRNRSAKRRKFPRTQPGLLPPPSAQPELAQTPSVRKQGLVPGSNPRQPAPRRVCRSRPIPRFQQSMDGCQKSETPSLSPPQREPSALVERGDGATIRFLRHKANQRKRSLRSRHQLPSADPPPLPWNGRAGCP